MARLRGSGKKRVDVHPYAKRVNGRAKRVRGHTRSTPYTSARPRSLSRAIRFVFQGRYF